MEQQTVEVEPAEVVARLVDGRLPSYTFRLLLGDHRPLQEYLAAGDAPQYPDGSLLRYLLDLDWQLPADVLVAQRLLLRLLNDQGRDVVATGRYRRWTELLEEQFTVRSRVQPVWLTMPAAYFATLLDEFSDLSGTDLEEVLRREVRRRFRYSERPPRWLHDEIWPVDANGPLRFVEQIDMSSGEHESYGYVFHDDVADERMVLVQSTWTVPASAHPRRPDPVAPHEPPADPQAQDEPVRPVEEGADGCDEDDPLGEATRLPRTAPIEVVGLREERSPWAPDGFVGTVVPIERARARREERALPAWSPPPALVPPPVATASQGRGAGGVPTPVAGLDQPDDVEATVVVDRSVLGQWSLVLEDGRTFALWSTSVVVGRRPRTAGPGVQTLTVPDEALTLSKTHARLDLVDGAWRVTDLGSTNGVVVAGADGQDTEVPQGGAAPVYGYLGLGTVGARIVPTSRVAERVPSATAPSASVPSAAATLTVHAGPASVPQRDAVTVGLPPPAPDRRPGSTPGGGGARRSTEGGTMTSKRETAAVRQFVAGTMPLGVFVQLLHRDLPLREYLASGGGVEAYAQTDLLGQLLRTDWQDMAGVRDAQQTLERFLRAQGVTVESTDLYQQRVDFHEKVRPLLAALQQPWLKIPVPYLALLLKESGDESGDETGGSEEMLRQRVKNRFRFLTHPPQWLHEEYWPVGRHGPLVFVEQVDVAPDRPGQAVNYVFVDPRDGAFLVLPQTRPEPDASAAPPASAEVRLPRGVVPVFARPGAFWLTQPDNRVPEVGSDNRVPEVGPDNRVPEVGPDGQVGKSDSGASAGHDVPVGAPAGPQALKDDPAALPRTEPVPDAPEPVSAADAPAHAGQQAAPSPVPSPVVPATTPLEPPQAPAVPVAAGLDRPWTLALADGRSFSVRSRSVLVGRRPQTDDPGVQALAVEDSTRSLSKTHARLDLVGDTWHVTDAGSTNGVVVTTADGQETKVEPGQTAPVYGYVAFGSVEARLQPDQAT